MFGWKNIPIRLKLPLTFAGLAVLVTLTIATASSILARHGQAEVAQQSFNIVGLSRHDQLHAWLSTVEAAVVTAASGSQAIDGLSRMDAAFRELGPEAQVQLQAAYIAHNENPLGKRHLLDRGAGDAAYHSQHFAFHKSFRTIVEQQGFYDLFLIDSIGNVVYTVAKEADFGANLQTGSLRDTNLADVYRKAMTAKSGEFFFSDFQNYAPSADAPAMFVATPIENEQGGVIGVLAVQISIQEITQILDSASLPGETTNIYLITSSMRSLTDSRFADGFKSGDLIADLPHVKDAADMAEKFYSDVVLLSGQRGYAQTFVIENPSGYWTLILERDLGDIMAPFYRLLTLELSLGLACIAVAAGLGVWVSKSFTKPISQLNTEIRQVAQGDYATQIANTTRGDEIGTIAVSLENLRGALAMAAAEESQREIHRGHQAQVVSKLTSALRDLSAGDLTQRINDPFLAEYDIVREYLNEAIAKMDDAVSQISNATEGIHAQAGEISRSSQELAHRTEVQAATLEQTAAAMDEMTASVKSAALGVEEVESIVRDARKDADQSGVVVKEAVAAMSEIEKSSEQISQIIGVIDDIAFQTNLLALNAGVEAARAGDAGRGFAVVASEVGALAQRASSAAKEIKTLIGTSSQHVERGVDRVKQAGDALQQIAQRVTHISTLTSNIATGSREQSIGLNEINLGVTQLDQATQKNAAMAEEATAASQLLKQGAAELTDLVGRFKLNGHKRAASNLIDLSDFAAPETPNPAESEQLAVAGRGVWQDF